MPDVPDTLNRPVSHLFQPGHKLSTGRKPGSKNSRGQLANQVFDDVRLMWNDIGPDFLKRLAFHDMAEFARFVAKILPQKIEIETSTPFDHVDEALLAISIRLSKSIAYLPQDDRELLELLLQKGELLASQKKLEDENEKRGGGAKVGENFVGAKVPPYPRDGIAPKQIIDITPAAADHASETDIQRGGDTREELQQMMRDEGVDDD